MKTRKQHLQAMVESLEQDLIIGEINQAFIKGLDPSQPYGIGQKTKAEALAVEEINERKQRKCLEIAKKLLAKEEAANIEEGGDKHAN